MLHLRGPSENGTIGYNVVDLAKETLGQALASERFVGRYLSSYAQIGGIVTAPQGTTLTLQGRENLKAALEARHAGADKAHRLLLLESGMSYTPTSTTPRDSQFAERREHEVRAIARVFQDPLRHDWRPIAGDLEQLRTISGAY